MPGYRPPSDPGVPSASRTYRAAAGAAFGIMRLQGWRFDVEGAEHLPRVGGYVLAANHTSFWDFFVAGREPYLRHGRPPRILAKQSLFDKPVLGPLMRAAEHIPVSRGVGSTALSAAVRGLRDGELVLVLPEQTISPALELLPFKSGAARMAALAGVPIVPVASWGTHRFHTVQRPVRPRWRLPISVAYGAPLRTAPDDDPGGVTAELRRRVLALHDHVIATYADGTPAGAWWVPARFGGGAPSVEQGEAYVNGIEGTFRGSSGRPRSPRRR